ncbi:hypothetical protein [Halovenus marina]|uniref:hypothetical protein n=1 Tax=Halovenus marina TaxID=3396621 RepID=UPI003F57AB91
MDWNRQFILRITLIIGGFTIILTACFVGLIALMSGEVTEFDDRLPWYLVTVAIVFVSTIIYLEFNISEGKTIIVSAIFTGILSFILTFFSVEGVLFAANNRSTVFDSRLIIYFFAAALVATGIGYWGIQHWREFTTSAGPSR